MYMPGQGSPSFSLGFLLAVCLGAWLSGAIFGWGVRETWAFVQGLAIHKPRTQRPLLQELAAPKVPARRRRRRRRAGYYFSEETRGWGDGRWRRRAGWGSLGLIVILIGGSLVVAASNYKPHRLPPAATPRRRAQLEEPSAQTRAQAFAADRRISRLITSSATSQG